jgi:hypothetical protein
MVSVPFRGDVIDFLVEFDAYVKQTAAGEYYCSLCEYAVKDGIEGAEVRYTKNLGALLRKHSFEPFLKWCRDNLREDRFLVMEACPSWDAPGVTAAFILSAEKLEARRPRLCDGYVVEPVLGKLRRPVSVRGPRRSSPSTARVPEGYALAPAARPPRPSRASSSPSARPRPRRRQ